MIKLDTNKEKKLEFTISLIGHFNGNLEAHFRIYFKNYQIGFPAHINNYEKVVVKLPKLNKFIQKFPEKARASLEIVQDRDMYLAWQDEVEFKQTDIKASLDFGTDDEKKEVEITASLKTDDDKSTSKKKEEKFVQKSPNKEISEPSSQIGFMIAEQLKKSSKLLNIELDRTDIKKIANEKKEQIKKNVFAYKLKGAFESATDEI